jgi:hypothetical protein
VSAVGASGPMDDDAEYLARENAARLAGLLHGREGWHIGIQDGTQ